MLSIIILEKSEYGIPANRAKKSQAQFVVYLHLSVYIKPTMRYSYDPEKKAANLKKHGLNFDDVRGVIESAKTVTFEDQRFDYGEARFLTLGLLRGAVAIITTTPRRKPTKRYALFPCERQINMSKKSTTKIADDAPITQADIDSGRLVLRRRGASGAVLPGKRRINIFLDSATLEYFKAKAGGRGYQTLINEALKQAMQAENLETVVRKTIREEMRKAA